MMGILNFIFSATFVTTALSATVPSSSFNAGGRCVLPVKSNKHWKTFWPLVFRATGTLYPVKETEINSSEELDSELDVVVTKGEEVIISCGPNYIASEYRSTSLNVKCGEDGSFYTLKGDAKELKELSCDLRSVEEVIVPVDGCPTTATSGKFGYVHPIDKTTRIIGESCYLENEGRTLFAHIRLGQDASEDSISNEKLNDKYFIGKQFPNSRYKLDFMKGFRIDEFKNKMKLLLDNDVKIPHYSLGNFVDIEHLISNKQFFAVKKLVWNYFPVFDNQIPYLDAVRKDIVELSRSNEIDVYVGSYGIMELEGKSGEKVSIYLDPIGNKYPVPKYIWFIIKSGKNTIGIAVANDPNTTVSDSLKICSSQCNKVSWLSNVKTAGYSNQANKIVCCGYNTMKNIIPEIPDIALTSKI
ncbi:uncharacterized protein LOC129609991 [Condylostylus longicornis]|uniref:uncharacterized protein LOC129609991 n=1 Tax=Condylostylus longicornis TaxID=2530218 RepID=UPI00244E2E2E|nr:uncharacterized protein LOC129609991 [Condylostylus longicornis]